MVHAFFFDLDIKCAFINEACVFQIISHYFLIKHWCECAIVILDVMSFTLIILDSKWAMLKLCVLHYNFNKNESLCAQIYKVNDCVDHNISIWQYGL